MRKTGRWILLGLLIVILGLSLPGQKPDPGKKPAKPKPALIRDDQTQEPPPAEEGVEIQPDPIKAERSYEIGLFYVKRKQYDAAIIRFREAVLYKPDFKQAKWMFLDTLRKKKDWSNLADFCASYLQDPNMESYRKDILQLQGQAQKELAKLKPAARP